MSAKITVIGSINMDMLCRAPRFPAAGETVGGGAFAFFPGGKGANQAVAAARLGAQVRFIGAVGADAFGTQLCARLAAENIDTCGIAVLPGCTTGAAQIIAAEGENRIIVAGGANLALEEKHLAAQEKLIAGADIVLCQLEIPLPVVQAAADYARHHGKIFILNPAPAVRLPETLLRNVTFLTPNEHEWRGALGLAETAAEADFFSLPYAGLITCGKNGVRYRAQNGQIAVQSAFAVETVDSTGAGDTFNGALAAFWHSGMDNAVRCAAAAAALSVTRTGAQTAMPYRKDLETFLAAQ